MDFKTLRPVHVLLAFFALTGLGLVISFTTLTGGRSLLDESHNYHAPAHPNALFFAGEPVPMDLFWVRESFDRELLVNTYWHSSTFLSLKRSGRYFPMIEPILKARGIPEDFKYLAVIESGLMQAVSPSGARGIWQFLPATAKEYGLMVNDEVDERYHVEKATQAACDYLQAAKDTLGSWTLAAAAYNAGKGGIRRAVKAQGAADYYALNLNTETARYVFRILALKTLMEQPLQHGYAITEQEKYPAARYATVTVDTAVPDLSRLAAGLGISYRALKEMNPWMRSTSLPRPVGKPWEVQVPEKGGRWY
ncbi:MAG TPA: lytic transglycosylase domain-containing protein [Bacteroidales bacterium]|nr:lytic transglycosylase domain-containing protein [Bacteroidales bacterium]